MPYIVYGRDMCMFSKRAALLAGVDLLPIERLRNPAANSRESTLLKLVKTTHITVPVVFYESRHSVDTVQKNNNKKKPKDVVFVGGCDDLERLLKKKDAKAKK
jgi:hypothetical protein